MSHGVTGAFSLSHRRARDVMLEITLLSLGAVALSWGALTVLAPHHAAADAVLVLVEIGDGVVPHIGWALGTLIAVLLALYLVVAGADLSGSADVSEHRRRDLGFAAELMAAAMAPALLAVVAVLVTTRGGLGVLLTVVPVSAVMYFLAANVGAFVITSHSTRVRHAQRDLERSRARLVRRRARSRRPVALVVAAHVAVLAAVAGAVAAWTTGDLRAGVIALALSVAVVGATAGMFVQVVDVGLGVGGRFERVVSRLLELAVPLAGAAALVGIGSFGGAWAPAAVAAGGALAGCLVSAFLPVDAVGPRLRDWSLSGVGRTAAARSALRSYRRARTRLDHLGDTAEPAEHTGRLGLLRHSR